MILGSVFLDITVIQHDQTVLNCAINVCFHKFYQFYPLSKPSLRSRCLEVMGERENRRAQGRQARGEGAPAQKAPQNRFNWHSVSADISNWSRGSQGKINRAGRENCQSIVHGQHSENQHH